MNNFKLRIIETTESNFITIDNYQFRKSSLIGLFIDEGLIWYQPLYIDGIVVLSELVRSLDGDGLYLIFTSVSGVADDGGWDGVNVRFKYDKVYWSFYNNENKMNFEFNLEQYTSEIQKVNQLKTLLPLEPTSVFYPEEWE